MCEICGYDPLDGSSDPYQADAGSLTRRNVLKLAVGTAAAAATLPLLSRASVAAAATPVARPLTQGGSATPNVQLVTMAMHVHSSFSEGQGSMESQLTEATANAVDVLCWAEHDWRMSATCYRTQVSFDSLDDEVQFGQAWTWQPTTSGTPATTGGGIVPTPLSANDPAQVGALEVMNTQTTAGNSASGFFALAGARLNHCANINGLTIGVDLYPVLMAGGGYLEVLVWLSRAPGARVDFGSKAYSISYRFGVVGGTVQKIGGNRPGRTVGGVLGVVTQAVPVGEYTTVELEPLVDAAALWPNVDPRDNVFSLLYLRAGCAGKGQAQGYFDNMTFAYPTLAQAQATQAALMAEYAPVYPTVQQIAASEVSFFLPHTNVFGAPPPTNLYNGVEFTTPTPVGSWFKANTARVRAEGGLTSLNHIYGTSAPKVGDTASVAAKLQTSTITTLLKQAAYGADIFEAGYRMRGGMTLEAHLDAWDACSRNGLAMTGNGSNDDHEGNPGTWATNQNRFLTCVWAASTAEADLVTALATGRAFVLDQSSFTGSIDLQLDDGTPMGGYTARGTAPSRSLTIFASTMPDPSSYFEVVMGVVDRAGTANPTPGTSVVTTVPASALTSGSTTIVVPTTVDCFYRLNLVNPTLPAGGERIAFSNPIWIVNTPLVFVDPRRRHLAEVTTVTLTPSSQVLQGGGTATVSVGILDSNGLVPAGTVIATLTDSSGNQVDTQQFGGPATYTSPVLDTDDTYSLKVDFTPTNAQVDVPTSATATVAVMAQATSIALSPTSQTIQGGGNAVVSLAVTDVNGAIPEGTLSATLVDGSHDQIDAQTFPAGPATYTSPALDTDDTYTLSVVFSPTDPAADSPSSASATVTVSALATTVVLTPMSQTVPGGSSAQIGVSITDANGAVPSGAVVAILTDSHGFQIDQQELAAGATTYSTPALWREDNYTVTVAFTPADPAADAPAANTATVEVAGEF